MTDLQLIAACDRLLATEQEVLAMDAEPRRWFMSKPGHSDCFTVARALRSVLETRAPKRKGPQMSETADPRTDPVQQIELWLKQYLEHVKCPDIGRQVNHALVFRIARTMIQQEKTLEDVQVIIRDMARRRTRPKSVGYIITVIEGSLGKVA